MAILPRENTEKKMKKRNTNPNSGVSPENENPRENAPETAPAAETPQELIQRLKAELAAARAAAAKPKTPPKIRMRKEQRFCLWLDHELHAALKTWAEEKASDKTLELAGNLLIAQAIGWEVPEAFYAAPKSKAAEEKEKTEQA